MTFDRQRGQKRFDMLLAKFRWVAQAMKMDVSSNPLHIRLLRAQAVVFRANGVAQLIEQFGGTHGRHGVLVGMGHARSYPTYGPNGNKVLRHYGVLRDMSRKIFTPTNVVYFTLALIHNSFIGNIHAGEEKNHRHQRC